MTVAEILVRIRTLFTQGFERLSNQQEIAALSAEALELLNNSEGTDISDLQADVVTLQGDVTTIQATQATDEAAILALQLPAIVTDATTARTLSTADRGKIILFTNASGCTVTVDHTLPISFSCALVQYTGGGAVTIGTDGGLTTILGPTSAATPKKTFEVGAMIGVTMVATATALAYGNLA